MIPVSVKNGYDINCEGKPLSEVLALVPPTHVAFLPERIPYIKPRLLVKTGGRVKTGTPLVEDKRNPDIQFMSPGSGIIESIDFGPRRVIKKIVVKCDNEESRERFDSHSEQDIQNIPAKRLVRAIMKGGLWALMRQLPFRDIADPEHVPPAIFVRLENSEPFHPEPDMYLDGRADLFQYGMNVLHRLAERVFVYAGSHSHADSKTLQENVTHCVKGKYPADDPGAFLYHIKKGSDENQSWYINGQDVLLVAALLKNGTYPVERMVTVAGSMASRGLHLKTRMGVPVSHLVHGSSETDKSRYIAGGLLHGYAVDPDSYLGFYETAITVIPKGNEKEFFGFARPGINKPSYSKTFLSVFNNRPLIMDSNIHGEERACINCGTCTTVCPVEILPQFTIKAILADELEDALAHGVLDCVECGLCSYVCPSKIEICDILKTFRQNYYKETCESHTIII